MTVALDGVSLDVRRGEVVGLVGENGAGKSTLLNIVSGNVRPDAGSVRVHGSEVSFASAQHANQHGVFHIYQELALVPNLTIYENLFLAHEDRFSSRGVIHRQEMHERARKFLAEMGHEWIDPSRPVSSYDFSTRQVVEVTKALALADLLDIETPVILLDEPTAGLTLDEVTFFRELVGQIRESAAVVFVSHRLAEIRELSDRIYVLRDGEITAEVAPDVTTESLHKLLVGRARPERFYREQRQREPGDAVVLEVRGLTKNGDFDDINLEIRAGEILGVAGLVGCGKQELARAIFGVVPDLDGEIKVDGRIVNPTSIRDAIRRNVGYVSPDRRQEGIMADLPVSWNMSIAALTTNAGRTLLDVGGEEQRTREFIESIGIKTAGPDAVARTLSGGNQQKVLLARWLFSGEIGVLILHNPTHGVDAGAKEEIYELLRSVADDDVAILLVSDDLLELIGLSNRVLVMAEGTIRKEFHTPPSDKPTEVDLVTHML